MLCLIKLDIVCKLPTSKLTYRKTPNLVVYGQEVPYIPKVPEVIDIFGNVQSRKVTKLQDLGNSRLNGVDLLYADRPPLR